MNQKELNNIIGNNIKKYRLQNKNKITQEKLAEVLNVSVSLISNIESKKVNRGISLKNLYKISIILDTPINKFFEVNNDKK